MAPAIPGPRKVKNHFICDYNIATGAKDQKMFINDNTE